jgi:hypothetical protein
MSDDKTDLIETIKAVYHRLEQAEAEIEAETATFNNQMEISKLLSGLAELLREHALELRESPTRKPNEP